jgi:hypothetical protein
MYRIISFAFTVNLTVFLHFSKYSHRYAMRTVCINRNIKRIVHVMFQLMALYSARTVYLDSKKIFSAD